MGHFTKVISYLMCYKVELVAYSDVGTGLLSKSTFLENIRKNDIFQISALINGGDEVM